MRWWLHWHKHFHLYRTTATSVQNRKHIGMMISSRSIGTWIWTILATLTYCTWSHVKTSSLLWSFLGVLQRVCWSAWKCLRLSFFYFRVLISKYWRSIAAKSTLFTTLMKWCSSSAPFKSRFALLKEEPVWSSSSTRDAIRSNCTSLVHDESYPCCVWYLWTEGVEGGGDNWTAGNCKSCAAPRGGTLMRADDRFTGPELYCKGIKNKVSCVSRQLCPQARPWP